MDNEEVIRAKLLLALAWKRKWGESHTAFENMFKKLRSESLAKDIQKQLEHIAEDLFREGFIIKKPTGYGLQVSLNVQRSAEIKNIIKKHLGIDL